MRTAFDIFLIIWIVVSVGYWLLAIGFGAPLVPPVNPGTILIFYGPWLIVLAMAVAPAARSRIKKNPE